MLAGLFISDIAIVGLQYYVAWLFENKVLVTLREMTY